MRGPGFGRRFRQGFEGVMQELRGSYAGVIRTFSWDCNKM